MDIHYTLMDPTRNITILVDTAVPRSAQSAVAKLLLQSQPGAEQVGFLEPSDCGRLRLQMMGGEFCGNAAMSLAALLTWRDGMVAGQIAEIPLEVSGAEGVLRCRIAVEADRFRGAVAMPRPDRIGTARVAGVERPAVFLPGIVHCIVPADALDRKAAETAIAPLCRLLGAEACGILLFDEATLTFTPLVYVPEIGTAVWERGCGSGSAAIGAWLAHQAAESRTVSLRQPGGVIDVSAMWRGRVTALAIAGTVRMGASGTLSIPL